MTSDRPLSRRQRQRLWKLVDCQLTPLQRQMLLACAVQGRKYSDVARERGVHRSTVLRTVERAKARLRRALEFTNLY